MSLPYLEGLRSEAPSCPSDLTLDELVADELHGEARRQAEEHLRGCPGCTERVVTLRRGFGAWPDATPTAILSALRDAATPPTPAPWRARLQGWLRGRGPLWVPLAVGAAVAVIVLTHRPPRPGPGSAGEGPGLRAKGALALHVHRMRGDGSEEMLSGAAFRPGDRLRFVVDVPWPGHLAVLGVEEGGALYTAWPLLGATEETLRAAGDAQALPGAVALDASPGAETLYLVLCPEPAGTPRCTLGGPGEPPRCQPDCATTPFVVDKGAR